MRIFLDANILFSAAKTDGTVRRILGLLSAAGHECCINAYVVGEARRNLAAKSPADVDSFERLLKDLNDAGTHPHASATDELRLLPEKDRPVLEAAIRGGCDILLTGDRAHFGRWFGKTLAGVAIHSPRTLVETLLT